MMIGFSRRSMLLGSAAVSLLSLGGGNAGAMSVSAAEQHVRERQAALRIAKQRYAKGKIPYANVKARERELAQAEANLRKLRNGGGGSSSPSRSQSTSSGSSGNVGALQEEVRKREVALRVAKERHAKGQIPYSYVEARERELEAAREELEQALNGGGGGSSRRPSRASSSGGNTIVVHDGNSLQSAFSRAGAGTRIVLRNGHYGRGGGFLLNRDGTSGAPITIEAQNTGEARFSSRLELRGNHIHLLGCRFEGAPLTVSRNNSRVSRCIFRGHGARLAIDAGAYAEIDHNEFSRWSGRVLDLNPLMSGRRGIRPHIHHNHFYDSSSSADVAISIGQHTGHHDINVDALVEHNLLENCNMEQAVRFKCSGNVFKRNTLINSGSVSNRHGRNNQYIENWVERCKAMLISDQRCIARGNRMVDTAGGIQVLAGDITPAQVSGQEGGHPRAENCQIIDNDGRLQIGRTYNWRRVYPALGTIVQGHNGKIVRGAEQGTSIRSTGNSRAGKSASKLSRSQVGV